MNTCMHGFSMYVHEGNVSSENCATGHTLHGYDYSDETGLNHVPLVAYCREESASVKVPGKSGHESIARMNQSSSPVAAVK